MRIKFIKLSFSFMNPMSSTKCFHICEMLHIARAIHVPLHILETESERKIATNNELFECILCLNGVCFLFFPARIYPFYIWYVVLSTFGFFFISC